MADATLWMGGQLKASWKVEGSNNKLAKILSLAISVKVISNKCLY